MGYRLEIKEYCEDCPEFEVTSKEEKYYEEGFFETKTFINQHIQCVHKKRCECMLNFLERKYKNGPIKKSNNQTDGVH